MPLTAKGQKILQNMVGQYGAEKGKRVFYASINKGTISGAEGGKHHSKGNTSGHASPPKMANRKVKHNDNHPGFAAVEKKIASQPGIRNAGAVLASRTRNASAAAKRKNPRLKRVKG